MPWVDQEKCVGCGICIGSCPEKAISMQDKKAAIDQSRCAFCGRCFSACPQDAIRSNSENPLFRGGGSHRNPGGGLGRGVGRGLRRWRQQ